MDSFPTFSLIENVTPIFRNTHHIYSLLFWYTSANQWALLLLYYCRMRNQKSEWSPLDPSSLGEQLLLTDPTERIYPLTYLCDLPFPRHLETPLKTQGEPSSLHQSLSLGVACHLAFPFPLHFFFFLVVHSHRHGTEWCAAAPLYITSQNRTGLVHPTYLPQ